MTPPSMLYRVEWTASRTFDRPWDQVEKSANFASAERAARQVAMIRSWPDNMKLLGLWSTGGSSGGNRYQQRRAGLNWRPLDPDTLRLSSRDAADLARLISGRATHPDERVRATAGAALGLPTTEDETDGYEWDADS